ncbi:Proteasome, alpha and beta subunits, partial [mine drainage metagenome]
VEPGASFLGYKADAIGSGKKIAEDILVKEYNDDLSDQDAIALGLKIIGKSTDGKKLQSNNVEVATIEKGKGYSNFSTEQIEKYL